MRKHRSSPYKIIKSRHVTEKTQMLSELQNAESNPSVLRCNKPKYVFIVDREANKKEISEAVEEIYKDQNVTVTAVNTITMKGKERRVRGRLGRTATFKKAVVTLQAGDSLENL